MKKIIISLISILLILVGVFLDSSKYIPQESFEIIMFIIAFIVMLVADVLPIMITSLFTFALLPLFGVTKNLNEAMIGFSNQVFLFVLASFILAKAISTVPFCKRVLKNVLKITGSSISKVILGIMICTAVTSAFISDVPTCVIYMAFAQEIINISANEEARRKNGRVAMLGISFASMIGGMVTPVGSTVNILAMNALNDITGESISFLQWVAIGLPVAIILLPICWFVLIKLYRPVEISKNDFERTIQNMDVPTKFTANEIKVVVLVSIMFILWVLSSFISSINVMVVMILGSAIMSIPALGIISIKELKESINWDVLFLVAAIITLGTLLINSGFSEIVTRYMPQLNMNVPCFVLAVAMIIFILLLIVPIAPSLTAIFVPVLIPIAQITGVSPKFIVVVCSICIACGYILPMDAVYLLTYSKGYYKIKDMSKVAFCMIVIASILCSTIGYIIGRIIGIA